MCISIEGMDPPLGPLLAGEAYRRFLSSAKPHITLRLRLGVPLSVPEKKAFECPPLWTLHRDNGKSAFRIFGDSSYPPGSERVLLVDPNGDDNELYFAPNSRPSMDPFHGPVLELLMVNHLGDGRGVIVHACGVAGGGKGLLFVGESGAGKSTIARLWSHEKSIDVLSDDRIVVRKKGNDFWMFGTPWHGEASFASPRGVRLERIFFLKHGPTCSIRTVEGVDSVSRFLTASFPPYWDPRGMDFTLDFFTELTAHVKCEELTFTPDRRVLRFIRETMASEGRS